ncbi:hypothetical protein D3C75_1252660 [compost metagenome]
MQIHFAIFSELKDRITYKLTGSVICNISSAIDFKQRDSFFFELLLIQEKMFRMIL